MIDWIEDHAGRQWFNWTGRTPRRIHSAVITAARHDHGRITVLLRDGYRGPEVVVKASADPVHAAGIEREFSRLREAHDELPPRLSKQVPVALEMANENDVTAMFSTAMKGRRPMVPSLLEPATRRWSGALAGLLLAVLTWTTDLARLTPTTGSDTCDEVVGAYLDRFPDHNAEVSALVGIHATRAWQHGDPAVGNLLIDRQGVRLIDWEHASSRSLPWHDQAYLVLVTGFLAAHQAGLEPVAGFDALYSPASSYGEVIRRSIENSWSHDVDIAHAVQLTAMTLAVHRTDAHGAWTKLANHLLDQRGPTWLRT